MLYEVITGCRDHRQTRRLQPRAGLGNKLKEISDKLTKGDYSVRLDLDTDDEMLIRLKNSLNQILA